MAGPPRPKRGPVGTGRGGWPGRWRGTPRPRRTAGSWRRRSSPCGSFSTPVSETTTGSSRPSVGRPAHGGGDAPRPARRPGAGAAPYPRTRSSSSTPQVGSSLSAAIRSRRRVGSIIGWARPWVRASSPKSMTTWESLRRSAPRASSGDSGMLDRMAPSAAPGDEHRLVGERAAAEEAPQRAGHRARGRRPRPARPLRCGRAVRGQRGLDGGGQVGPSRPEGGPVDRLAQRRGVRLHLRQHLGRRRLGHDDDRGGGRVGGQGRERLPGGAAADGRGQVAAADAEAVAHADAGGVEQAHDLLGAGARGGDEPDRAGARGVGEAERDPADDRGAAVGAHQQHVGRRPPRP